MGRQTTARRAPAAAIPVAAYLMGGTPGNNYNLYVIDSRNNT